MTCSTSDLKCASDLLEQNGFVYFCGYLLKKLATFHKCTQCSNLRDCNASVDDFDKVLIHKKSFDANNSLVNGLIVPSESFVKTVEEFESVFSFFIRDGLHKQEIKHSGAKTAIKQVVSQNTFCSAKIYYFMLGLFVRCRIYFFVEVSHASAVAQGNVVRAVSASYGKSLYSTLRRSQIP
jgi:hypothetical protein